MTVERALRAIAGTFILLSLALGTWVNPKWYWFTAFVGANLLQSGFSNWCPMITILKKLGVRTDAECAMRAAGSRQPAAGS